MILIMFIFFIVGSSFNGLHSRSGRSTVDITVDSVDGAVGGPEGPYSQLPECFHDNHECYKYPSVIQKAINNVRYIHFHKIQQDKFDEVSL